MRWRHSTIPVTLSLLSCFAVTLVRGDNGQAVTAAIVLDYKGYPDDFKIIRQGAEPRVATFAEILVGDQIAVDKPSARVTLRFTDGTKIDIGKGDSPYRVELRGKPVTLTDKIGDRLSRSLKRIGGRVDNDRLFSTGAPTGTRGPTDGTAPLQLRTPGIADAQCVIAAGDRRLGLAWQGGLAPYQVRITQDARDELLAARVDAPQVITIDPRNLKPGTYEVAVQDMTGQQATGSCSVVEPANFPTLSVAVPSWLGPEVARIVAACERASADSKRWSYDGYLLLIGQDPSFHTLEITRRAIADGACETPN